MIPSIIDQQIREGVRDYVRTTYPVTTKLFSNLVEGLLTDEDRMFKGPYIGLDLPFRKGSVGADVIPDFPMAFPPYIHQEKAFTRLRADSCKSTIVATGTGSGKTECFLYPILEYCLRRRQEKEPGIKAIIIYPMNALAQDQARRIAQTIWNNEHAKGKITAGLYVGGEQKSPHQVMGDNHIITDRETIRLRPPDILLTNYKMLDYMLSRPHDRDVWSQNAAGTVRYLVVDELHTFDGAQGTDLACLIRRLKYRLGVTTGNVCCVGTSATLGGPESIADLRAYAQKVFGEDFDDAAVITEAREDYRTFLRGSFVANSFEIPARDTIDRLKPDNFSTPEEYIREQVHQWFGDKIPIDDYAHYTWRETLGERLKEHPLVRTILEVLDGHIVSEPVLLRHLRGIFREFAEGSTDYHRTVLQSLFALISIARRLDESGVEPIYVPFVRVRYQSWLREMRRIVSTVSHDPRLEFAADLTDTELQTHLPVVHCRECGSTGWAGLKKQNEYKVRSDLNDFYAGYFAKNPSPNICYLFPDADGLEESHDSGMYATLCENCFRLSTKEKTTCGDCESDQLIGVYMPNNRVKTKKGFKSRKDCPVCKTTESLVLVGARAASLSSVMINQLFGSPYNENKKLIAFSDSVQDASHRAGFYGARTWRFNFRAAVQQCLDAQSVEPAMSELPALFCAYWKQRMSIEEYVATFLPPDMAWLDEFVELQKTGNGNFSQTFLEDLDKRISWEIYSEYGLNSRVGRTLEKACCSVPVVGSSLTAEHYDELRMKLENRIGTLRGKCPDEKLRKFTAGIFKHLVGGGAFYQDILKQYIERNGNIYYVRWVRWMRDFGPGIFTPRFPATTAGHESRLEKLTSRADRPTSWYAHWLVKHFGFESLDILNYFPDFYTELFSWLVNNNIMEMYHSEKRDSIWTLLPQETLISRNVDQHSCSDCGHKVAAPSSERALWDNQRCMKPVCRGVYIRQKTSGDYYTHLYKRGDIHRLFPREHTGLLTRDEREPLEDQFKARAESRKSWYPNLLSCTPTLEMGIDIGDLSSVLLCSVPPKQAAYLQRIGRAGRTNGNSSCTTIANGLPHDLYFFSEPDEMMQGHVTPPGVYLDASAVLERQLTAFCLDCWVHYDSEAVVPTNISPILSKITKENAKGFPFTLFAYVNKNKADIEENFTILFGGSLSDSTRQHLHDFLHGGNNVRSMEDKIINGLRELLKERQSLERKRNLLSSRIRKMKADSGSDPDLLDDLILERDAFSELIKKINNKNTYEFLTTEGLTPNYAFPESGVQLQSIIYRRNKAEGKKYLKTIYEYERAAASAIKDLVPGNVFYAHGRKVVIDQVNLALSKTEIWRFCPECSYFRLENEESTQNTCPSCGCTMWADGQQRHKMLKVKQVLATTPAHQGLITDDADNRELHFFRKYMFFGHKKEDIESAWQIDDEEAPFGFEVLNTARFQEINFGEPDTNGVDIRVSGKDIDATGFNICRHCGKIQKEGAPAQHSFGCSARSSDEESNFAETFFLYRDFESEAIRFFIPSITELSDRKLQSFLASLMFGLTKYYKGDVTHLQTCIHDEPIDGSPHRRRFVVLFDTVPGGTGYLKEVARRPEAVFDILEEALKRLNTCACNQTDRDGCYACLYAYRNSFDMENISRETAKELLSALIKKREMLSQIPSVSTIRINALLESELERRFIAGLDEYAGKTPGVTFSATTVGVKSGYRLDIGENTWLIEPQVEFGPQQGVAVASRADFVFRDKNGTYKPVAVFTDGYQYHCDRVKLDTAQRLAISQSGAYNVWSLTWTDVETLRTGVKNAPGAHSLYLKAELRPKFDKALSVFKIERMAARCDETSMAWLIDYLGQPYGREWEVYALLHILSRMDPAKQGPDELLRWEDALNNLVPGHFAEVVGSVPETRLCGDMMVNNFTRMISAVTRADMAKDGVRCAAALIFDDTGDIDQRAWEDFLQWTNLVQFLPGGYPLSKSGISEGAYEAIPGPKKSPAEHQKTSGWEPVHSLVSESLRPLIDTLAEAGVAIPEVGYELLMPDGSSGPEAELAWEEPKIAVLWSAEDAEEFRLQQWRVHLVDEIIPSPEKILDTLKGAEK